MSYDKWNLNRVPSEREQRSSIIVSLFFSITFGVLCILWIYMLFNHPDKRNSSNLYFLFGVSVLFLISLIICLRSIFTERKKASGLQILLLGYFIMFVSLLIFPLTIFYSKSFVSNIYLLAIAFTGIPGSIGLIRQGKKQIRIKGNSRD